VSRALKRVALGAAATTSRLLVPCGRRVSRRPGGWRVPILAYHQVAESGAGDYPWTVTPTAFAAHMEALAQEGCAVVSLDHFVDQLVHGRVAPYTVVLTFDDGFRGVWLHAQPILKRYGFTATLFLATGFMGGPNFPWVQKWLRHGADHDEWRPLQWSEVREMNAAGLSIGSHTVSHPHLGRCSPDDMAREVKMSRMHIQRYTGVCATSFAYPGGIQEYGDHSEITRAVVQGAGYRCAVVSELGRNGPDADPLRLRRLGMGVEDSAALVKAKVLGAYSWVRMVQWGAQRMFADPSHY
jgi:peptidoglycan/xylan/chitin deacetylase (PgdA/CDA1 family)